MRGADGPFAAADCCGRSPGAFRVGRAGSRLRLACAMTAGRAFRSEHYQVEIDHLGIAAHGHHTSRDQRLREKLIQTLKEQCLDRALDTFEESEPPSGHSRHLQPPVAARAPQQPTPIEARSTYSASTVMISLFTKVSGEPGRASGRPDPAGIPM